MSRWCQQRREGDPCYFSLKIPGGGGEVLPGEEGGGAKGPGGVSVLWPSYR